MWKYFLSQLTQMSFWYGVLLIICALFGTRGEIFFLAIVMMFLHDETIKNFITKHAPGLAKWIQSVVDDL